VAAQLAASEEELSTNEIEYNTQHRNLNLKEKFP
jgi:hypothetical protein